MPIEIFFCYAHEDEALKQRLEKQLKVLKRQGIIHMWHDRLISAGQEWEREIDRHLNTSQIILLLISPHFLDSDYCYGREMKRAMERHERGEARVIPIILSPVYWQGTPLGKLQALPTNAKPVIAWRNRDIAFFDVAEGIRKTVEELAGKPSISVVEEKSPLNRLCWQKTEIVDLLRPQGVRGVGERPGLPKRSDASVRVASRSTTHQCAAG